MIINTVELRQIKPINLCVCDDFKTVKVKLKQGELSGKEEFTYIKEQKFYSFNGIPYAEPPVGELRFKPPVSHNGWENIYEAHTNKPTCIQYNSKMRIGDIGMSGSEDCLYISVFTPNLEGSAPVIVFDYNDNFGASFNGTETYSPDFFIEENIVIVTISHRLGLLGYLSTGDDVIPGNAGLRDFIMGLNWIQNNIHEFGGDPNSVTLMGNRGGAVITDILLHSPKAKKLFSGVIMQSGTALEPLFLSDQYRERAFDLGNVLNITANDSETLLKGLQNVDVELMYSKESDVIQRSDEDLQKTMFTFSPIIENDNPDAILTTLPDNSKIVNDVPIMIGMNSREGLDLASHFIHEPNLVAELAQEFLFLFPIKTNYRFNKKSKVYEEAIKEILNFYFEEGYFYYNNVLEYSVYVGDLLQNYALNLAAKKLTEKTQSPIYYYMFDFRGRLNENSEYISKYTRYGLKHWGATVTDELCYLHLCSRIKQTYKDLINLVSEQPEIKVLKKVVRLWANFAKTRNPTPLVEDDILKDFKWLPINKESNETNYVHITKTLKMKVNPLGEREKFWDNFLAKYSELAIDGVVQDSKIHDEL
ncbi:esterase E4-like [Vanessa atalanta]|uniref:esterase E4-like n=1 Tax=Vanessa atalanta TaxID=42275 RepID=UPI001FCD9BAB|nr:esterase E4-like [Vanessa atalanta]